MATTSFVPSAPPVIAPPSVDPSRRIVAFAFDSALRAQEALLATLRLQERGMLELHDAVFIVRKEGHSARVTETTDPIPVAAAVPASLFGAVVGTLVAGPIGFLIGGVLAGATGALAARMLDTGIPDRVIGMLRGKTLPGEYVIALLVSHITADAVVEELGRFQGAHVVYADLPSDVLARVRTALHEPA